jgi:hypothetical protein
MHMQPYVCALVVNIVPHLLAALQINLSCAWIHGIGTLADPAHGTCMRPELFVVRAIRLVLDDDPET